MKSMTVSAKAPKVKKEASVTVQFPESLEEAKKVYSEDAILSNAFANWRVTLQAGIRKALEAGLEGADIQKKFADAKLGVAQTGSVDPVAAFAAMFKSLTPEEQKKKLAELRQLAAG